MQRSRHFSLYALEDTETYHGNTGAGYYSGEREEVLGVAKGKIKNAERDASPMKSPAANEDETEVNVRGLRRMDGNLHLASRCIIFEPEDASNPVILFPFDVLLSECRPTGLIDYTRGTAKRMGIAFHSRYVFLTTQLGVPCPHRAMRTPSTTLHCFEVPWDRTFYEKANALIRAFRSGDTIPAPAAKFDFSMLGTITEQIVIQSEAEFIEPLLRTPGSVVLTDRCLYLHSSYSCVPLRKIPLADIVRCERRRRSHKDTAVEVMLKKQSTLIALPTERERDCFYRGILQQPHVSLPRSESLEAMMKGWLVGKVSTFDYLMFLNWVAGRTMTDLSQYPVMPWVLADYSSGEVDLADPSVYRDFSLPIGALNKQRLKYFQERMRESQEPYLYGTHYSCPGYVVYYLIREKPEWNLKLHNGSFDKPDRIFESIESCWKSVSSQPHDLKELIPQFFFGEGAFLKGQQGMSFGKKTAGESVRPDVQLPPWCGGSAEAFVRRNREALEGEHCSQNIHKWIDLIFGYKARGEQAFQADNLFHPLTYDAADDIEKEANSNVRAGLEQQVREFGQCPLQLFSSPHPRRKVQATDPELVDMSGWAPPVRDLEEEVAEASSVQDDDSPVGSPGSAGGRKHSDLLLDAEALLAREGHPLAAVYNICHGLIEQVLPLYVEPDPSNSQMSDGCAAYVQTSTPSSSKLLISINDSEVSSVLYHYFITNNKSIVLDDMVWFVPKTGEVFVRRTSSKSFPAKHLPSIAWTESIMLNVVVQWEYELVVAVVHEPPRRDNTLYAADWFRERVYATPTSSTAHMVDGTDAYCIAYPNLIFASDSNTLSRLPQGAYLYAVELNAVCVKTRSKVPILRTAVGHVDLSRHFEKTEAAPGKASTKAAPIDYVCFGGAANVSVKIDDGSTWLSSLRGKKARESALSCKLCFLLADRLDVMAAIGASVKGHDSVPWLHLPECHRREPTARPPRHLPGMVDLDEAGGVCSLESSVSSDAGVKHAAPSISPAGGELPLCGEMEKALGGDIAPGAGSPVEVERIKRHKKKGHSHSHSHHNDPRDGRASVEGYDLNVLATGTHVDDIPIHDLDLDMELALLTSDQPSGSGSGAGVVGAGGGSSSGFGSPPPSLSPQPAVQGGSSATPSPPPQPSAADTRQTPSATREGSTLSQPGAGEVDGEESESDDGGAPAQVASPPPGGAPAASSERHPGPPPPGLLHQRERPDYFTPQRPAAGGGVGGGHASPDGGGEEEVCDSPSSPSSPVAPSEASTAVRMSLSNTQGSGAFGSTVRHRSSALFEDSFGRKSDVVPGGSFGRNLHGSGGGGGGGVEFQRVASDVAGDGGNSLEPRRSLPMRLSASELSKMQRDVHDESREALATGLIKWQSIRSHPPVLASVADGCDIFQWGYVKYPQKKMLSFVQRTFSKRLLIVQGSYIYFFGSQSRTSECKGSVMTFGAHVLDSNRGSSPQYVLTISPAALPDGELLGLDRDEGAFIIAFSQEEQRRMFRQAVEPGVDQHVIKC